MIMKTSNNNNRLSVIDFFFLLEKYFNFLNNFLQLILCINFLILSFIFVSLIKCFVNLLYIVYFNYYID